MVLSQCWENKTLQMYKSCCKLPFKCPILSDEVIIMNLERGLKENCRFLSNFHVGDARLGGPVDVAREAFTVFG